MDISQPTSWESPAPLAITWPLPCPRSPYHLQVTVSHGTPPLSVFGGLCCVKSPTPCDQSLISFVQQDQLPLPTYPGGGPAWEAPSLCAHRCQFMVVSNPL